jgi:hypothetical protein
MAEIRKLNGFEIDEDMAFQEKEWVLQRIGWVIMGLIILAAVGGLIGPGLFSKATAQANAISVEHERFIHFNTDTAFIFHIQANVADEDGKIRLWINSDYLNSVHVQQFMPEAESFGAGAERHIFVFEPEDVSKPATIKVVFHAMKPGVHNIQVGLVGNETLSFSQFVYP